MGWIHPPYRYQRFYIETIGIGSDEPSNVPIEDFKCLDGTEEKIKMLIQHIAATLIKQGPLHCVKKYSGHYCYNSILIL